ncbi:uncharacterized protein YaiE (UPF0345 family) [Chryseobacterium bernardetii]|uniref:Uncharacterized protein n=2 Tax=Chryseobacterium TaxID=59732 RepID=A0A543EG04_9FLAO|nr:MULTISPECIES: hypothetical protein [Chryseobacterium]MDR6370543.1 uncharacterized protein YaiE (UPF0345 family) [Chryseobacterium vietnamense]MDR6441549.1 uncharacterized protein YaiE (UPF0345 family) [Chryseobacterium bernardetii]TQM20503.1 hypothetical protein FB551_0173 [Chryseobacterium aquifrigidense]
MKKKVLPVVILLLAFCKVRSQVGINTTSPAATFDINAKNATGTSTNVDGVLITRLDRQRAQSMTGVPTSTLIYVNSVATGTQTGTAVNIDAVGYYYYNGSVWTKLANPVNIYNADGTLTGNRTVTQGANTLAFTGTKTNAFSVNGKNFSVDAANSRVGIGTIAPASSLSVQNSSGATNSTISAGIENCGAACLQGIARNITLYNLNSTGGQFAELGFIPSTSETGLSGASITGIDRDAANSYAGLQFSTRNATDYAPRLTIKSSGNVGIGTTSPTNKLQIESTTSGALKIVDGTQGTDKVLTSDASGVATWKALPAAPASANIYNTDGTLTGNRTVTQGANTLAFTGTQTNAFSVNGKNFSVDAANSRVGIGTIAPASSLSVQNSPGATTSTISAGIENCGAACLQGIARNITLYNLNSTGGQFAELGFIPSTSETGLSGASISGIDRDAANSYAGLQFSTRNATDYAPRLTIKSSGNVGIGTTSPTNKLQIESSTSGALKIVDGTQGTDKVLTSDASGVATWKALPAAPASANIYNTDGTLTANRTVTQGANTLAFTGTQTNAFSVDGSTLSVDAANGLVGLGTTTPDTKLTISTPDSSFGLNHTNGTVNLKTYIGGGAATVGTTTANDLRFMTNNTQKMTVTSSGNVGIGTTTPNTKLTVSTADNSFGITHTNGTVSLETYIGGGSGYVGTTTSNTLNLMTNNSPKMTITPTGNVGVGTLTPGARLEVNSGTANVSGLKFTNLNSSSPTGTGQAIGVDASGNVIAVSTTAQVSTTENAVSNVPGSPTFSVNDLGYTPVPGTVQNITIPAGGKALFINFMLGIDYYSLPSGGGTGFYQAILFIDNVATNVYQTVQESGPGAQAQFNLSSVKFLTAGNHMLYIAMIRQYNNGTASGANMACTPISVSFNSTYIN